MGVVTDADRPADERVHAGVDVVRQLTDGQPAMVIFEDLHWADSESVRVFERLAEPENGPLLLVGTYRPDGLSRRHPASEMLPRLERRHSVTHLHLDRLSPSEVSSFLAAVFEEEPSFRVVDALHTRTGGNPFFLEELVASAADVSSAELADMPLPWTVEELVRSEVDELDPEVREMVSAASVLGRRVTFDLLAAVTGASELDLITRLRSAVDNGLLVESDPDVFRFHHELAREAIEGGLLGRERRRLHEVAFDALRSAHSRDRVALAHHARGAGKYDETIAEARLGAHESLALGSSFQALRLAETGLAESPDDFELLSLAARAAWLAALPDDAAEHCDRWLWLARSSGQLSEEAAALSLRIRLAFEQGDIPAMVRFTDALIGIIDRLPTDVERARAMPAVAQSYQLRELLDETCEWADRALALAEQEGLTDVRLAAMVEKGSVLLMHPEWSEEARQLLESAALEAEQEGEHLLAARALNNMQWNARRWSDADEVKDMIDRMRVQAVAAGFDVMAVADVYASLAHLAAVEGDLRGAIAHVDEGRQAELRRGVWRQGQWSAVFRAGLALETGDLDGAEMFAAEAKPVTPRTAAGVIGLDFHIACRRGRPELARSLLADLLLAAEAEGSTSPSQTHDLLSAGLAAGLSTDELRPLVDMVGYFAGHRLPEEHPWRRLLDAQLAEAEGRTDEAADLYSLAAAGLGSAPELLAGPRGTAHVGAARSLARLDRIDEAKVHVEAAAQQLLRWGGWRVDDLRAVERRLGLGDEPAGPEALTPREREVIALLADGLTNAQLAERLYISPRTAAVHVSNILSKLALSSRTEAAAWAIRAGLARS